MQSCINFIGNLAKNNNREWFEANRKHYEAAKKSLELVTDDLISEIRHFDPSLGILKAKECTFRIFRDIRFSHDKTPYKTNMGTYIARGGIKSIYAGYYLHLQPGDQSFASGGIYMPPGDNLKAIRQEIFYNVDEFKKILNHKDFKQAFKGLDFMGDEIKKAPQGYDPAWPDINLLKFKNYFASSPIKDSDFNSKIAREKIVTAFIAVRPLVAFINRALGIPTN
jgi:uncharacterized protein (TIGR02453 family)